jgi:hypothetical protein
MKQVLSVQRGYSKKSTNSIIDVGSLEAAEMLKNYGTILIEM